MHSGQQDTSGVKSMGKFRKASQLAAKLQQLTNQRGSSSSSSSAPADADKRLADSILPANVTTRIQTLAFPDGGNGFMFMLSNNNASIMGHIKFHPNKNSNDRDSAAMHNYHVVLEGVKFRREDGVEVTMKFGDNIRTAENAPAHGSNKFYEDGVSCTKTSGLDIDHHSRKPVLRISSYYDRRQHKVVYKRPMTDSYLSLCESLPAISESDSLLAGIAKLANQFYKVTMSSNTALFKENNKGSADDLLDLTEEFIEQQVSDNAFDKFPVPQRFNAIPEEKPQTILNSDSSVEEKKAFDKAFPELKPDIKVK